MDSQLVRRGLGSEQARGYQLCGRKVITPRSRGAVPIPPPHARVHARRHARELHGTLTHSMARSHTPWHAHTRPQIPPLPPHAGMAQACIHTPGGPISPGSHTPPYDPCLCLSTPSIMPSPTTRPGCLPRLPGPAISHTSPLGSAPGPASLSQQAPVPLSSADGPWMGAPAVPTAPPALGPLSLNPVLPFSGHPTQPGP